MALQATIYNFDIELADNDRAVYESLALRLARHPSESDEHLIARLLAYLLEFTSGIAFSRGVSEPDEPAIAVRDPTGRSRPGSTSGARMPAGCTRRRKPRRASSSTHTRSRGNS